MLKVLFFGLEIIFTTIETNVYIAIVSDTQHARKSVEGCCKTYLSAVYLSNKFLKRSVKWQAHYFSWLETQCSILETRYSKLSRIENQVSRIDARGTVNLLLSGTVASP